MNKKSAADDTDCDVPSICDDDSNDNDNLVIDNKDDGLEEQDLPDDSGKSPTFISTKNFNNSIISAKVQHLLRQFITFNLFGNLFRD